MSCATQGCLSANSLLAPYLAEDDADRLKRCVFSQRSGTSAEEQIDLSSLIEEAVLQLRPDVPKELVVSMFQKFVREFVIHKSFGHRLTLPQNLRRIIFTTRGKLTGMVTLSDVVSLLTCNFPHTAALAPGERRSWG